jgi:hypothetical protein
MTYLENVYKQLHIKRWRYLFLEKNGEGNLSLKTWSQFYDTRISCNVTMCMSQFSVIILHIDIINRNKYFPSD